RQRVFAGAVALAVALGGGGFAAAAFLGSSPKPASSSTPTATASASLPAGTVACGGTTPPAAATVAQLANSYSKAPKMAIDPSKTYVATMRTSCGTMKIQLDARTAPNTVNSIVFLAHHHFFDGSPFHRIVPNFVIEGGAP